jgi:hypothetical protein
VVQIAENSKVRKVLAKGASRCFSEIARHSSHSRACPPHLHMGCMQNGEFGERASIWHTRKECQYQGSLGYGLLALEPIEGGCEGENAHEA